MYCVEHSVGWRPFCASVSHTHWPADCLVILPALGRPPALMVRTDFIVATRVPRVASRQPCILVSLWNSSRTILLWNRMSLTWDGFGYSQFALAQMSLISRKPVIVFLRLRIVLYGFFFCAFANYQFWCTTRCFVLLARRKDKFRTMVYDMSTEKTVLTLNPICIHIGLRKKKTQNITTCLNFCLFLRHTTTADHGWPSNDNTTLRFTILFSMFCVRADFFSDTFFSYSSYSSTVTTRTAPRSLCDQGCASFLYITVLHWQRLGPEYFSEVWQILCWRHQ